MKHARSSELAHRIEVAETRIEAGAFESWFNRHPTCGGAVTWRDNAVVMHDCTPEAITRLWGFALGVEPEVDLLDEAIAEGRRRGHAKVTFEWNPYMHEKLFPVLGERGFVVQEFTHTYILEKDRFPAGPARPLADDLDIAVLDPADDAMVDAAIQAWAAGIGSPEPSETLRTIGRIHATWPDKTVYLALHEGRPVAIGTMAMHEGLAFLGTASTMPAFRGKGIQNNLLHARIRHALDSGCDMVTIGSDPGTVSQRNIERTGFRGVYTKLTVKLELKARRDEM